MQPWVHLGNAVTPGGDTLRLARRGHEFSIKLGGGTELMNSRLSGSEEALATLVIERLAQAGNQAPRLMIGGLGMGFTLRAAQAAAGPEARFQVVEIVPEIVDWARGPMAELFGGSLSDPRAEVLVADVGARIAAASGAWDGILLDVDNGPEGLTRPGNSRLYGEAGLAAARKALAPGGILAVWSAFPDANFGRRVGRAGFAVETVTVRAGRTGKGARHTIWLGRRD
ncbi:MAG: spermidine synthase [Pseudomonadota bacterium]|nr:spermidine synthase [Pseudomonadota bacterium]MEE3101904.1 spermidine synthase [Pseudomonadota bacterium]